MPHTAAHAMDTSMPHPLPNATSGKRFHAGEMASDTVKYPHLPKSVAEKAPSVRYPSLSKSGKAPATKRPMGYTSPIMTKHGGHPADSGSRLPPIGNA